MAETSARQPVRPWRLVAEEASREYDAGRMIELIAELNQALEEQGLIALSESTAERKTA